MSILVYSDEGVSPKSLKHLMHALKGHPVTRVNRNNLKEHLKQASLLIIPGGRDIPYHEALKGELNEATRLFVENGGSYLGLCAGGYYGAASIEFEKGYPLEVIATRELKFFPGKAIGPAYGKGMFGYQTEKGSRIAQLEWNDKLIGVYYNGGCHFSEAEKYPNTTIIARYKDLLEKPAAIIECTVGKGKAILSGIHPEYGDTMPNGAKIKHFNKDFFPYILKRLCNLE